MPQEDQKDQIIKAAIEILRKTPQGMRTGEFTAKIRERLPGYPLKGGIHGTVLKYARGQDAEIYQPARGWFRHKDFHPTSETDDPPQPARERALESAFYQPFADWLVEDLEECTKAVAVGGAKLKDKWGTPDVIGIYEPPFDAILKFPIEIVSVEIKVSGEGLITAFGQACSYRLFSHKSYIAIPRTASAEDRDRLEALCLLFGIGLVLFDSASPLHPDFDIRTRASKHEPDMFYANEKIRHIGKELLG